MGKRRDWSIEQARQTHDLMQGLSREVAVNYLASVLKMASQRGAIEGAKANGAAPVPVKAKTAEKIL